VKGLHVFFTPEPEGIMFEVACERNGLCDIDQRSFKAYLSRWMAASIKVAPYIREPILARLRKTAPAAVSKCNTGADGNQCQLRWWQPGEADTCKLKEGGTVPCTGVGEQMMALEVVQSLLIDEVGPPLTNATGGTSRGDPTAGTGGDNPDLLAGIVEPATTGGKAGAAILTIITLCGLFFGAYWMGFNA
jgi:mannan endo-1,6-alpha-mannosidase